MQSRRQRLSRPGPLWRQGFDLAERAVGKRLEDLVSTRTFSDALVLVFRGQNAVYGIFERQTRATLHFWNMPARTDISRLRRQVAELSSEVQRVAATLEAEQPARRSAELEGDGLGGAIKRTTSGS
jgi:hypothetical protein